VNASPAACSDRISLVVLTYNRSRELSRSLSRLVALPDKPRIIVVDNGSTDDTAECVQTQFTEVEFVRSPANLGAAGRNLGVQRVTTPYVAFSDDDTWWSPGSLSKAADMLDAHPHIAVLVARILVGVEERPDPASMAMSGSPLERIPGIGPLLVGFMAGASVMRTQAFRDAGGYWSGFFIGGEESLLAMDILDSGHQIVFAPALQVHHWPSEHRDTPLRQQLLVRNAIWTAWLRLPWRLAWKRTVSSLRDIKAPGLRSQVMKDALKGARQIYRNRRVLSLQTCKMLQQVWRHEEKVAL
jgi:Predicted glycosyltransferases